MTKKFHLALLICCSFTLGAQAQLGKLKGLVNKKEKTEESKPADKSDKSDSKAADSPAGEEEETSTANVAANPKAWSVKFDKNIDWFKLSSTGKLIASTNDALYGIDPASGKTAWKRTEFKNLTKENYNPIPNSPYIAIVTGGMLSMHHAIVDVTDGRIVGNTKDMGVKYVSKRYVVPSLGGIIFSGIDDKGKPALVMMDAATGKKVWTLQNIFESNKESLVARPIAVDGNSIMLATTKRVYKINTSNGAVTWKADFATTIDKGELKTDIQPEAEDKGSTKGDEPKKDLAGKIPGIGGLAKMTSMGSEMKSGMAAAADMTYGKFLVVDNMPGMVYYYTTNSMTAFNLASGAPAWTAVKFADPVSEFLQDERGFLVATNDKNSELLLLDYKTGQEKWKPLQLSGNVSAINLNNGKLAVASTKGNGANVVNVVDINTGAPVSKSAMKVSGQINDIKMTEKGLIYRTSKETNIQDVNTGKDIWASSLSYKEGGGIGVDKGNKTYIWGNNQLYILDQASGEYKKLGNGVKFGGDEVATKMELREKGIFVSSDQNMALFDWDGNKIYHVYQKAPGISTFGKIMNITAMAVSMSQSASHGFQSGLSGGQSTSAGRSEAEKADRWGNLGSAAASDLNRRFKASQGADSYQVILTKVNTGTDSGIGLVRVNKDSGKIEAKVVIDDKKPDYIADDIDNLIFYKDANDSIVGYHL